MLHRASHLQGCHLEARDGTIGKIKDLLFDDESWTVRYLVANTGRWLPGRRVLLSPSSVIVEAMRSRKLPVDLTRAQIERSPGSENNEPVSAQHQRELHTYYGWRQYWTSGPYVMAGVIPILDPQSTVTETDTGIAAGSGDPHLRSTDHVSGYAIHALDGTIGHVEDFLVDVSDWTIRLLVVDTRNWLPGRKVVVPPGVIDRISWTDSEVAVHLSREAIQESPEYKADDTLDPEYVQRMSDYYDHLTVRL